VRLPGRAGAGKTVVERVLEVRLGCMAPKCPRFLNNGAPDQAACPMASIRARSRLCSPRDPFRSMSEEEP
jgi:hypothetical protein